jgi:two-component system CheB/CheR fusion protein
LVVGLGASAGGIEAFEGFLSHLPSRSGLIFVVVQHLESRHPSMLVELLARHTKMPVAEATEDVQPEPDHVYVIAPGTLLTVEKGILRVATDAPTTRASIDTFFRSLAEDQGERAVGILFSGAGHDGTVGLRAIKARGGLTLAQSPETARHDSMPQSAIAAGLVDHVLPVAEMPAKVLEHAAFVVAAADVGAASLDAQIEGRLDRICALIHQHTGHDFGRYKPGTLVRRIRRRIQIQHLESVDQYVQLLEKAEGEPEGLLKDLLIGVTQFFRDPEAFQALAQQVVPRIVQGKAADGPIRIWVPGCASGEEAYSIAILVLEHLERLGARRFVQIFATDLDAELLREARLGRYPKSIDEHVPADRLARFFVRDGQKYQAAKELREMCIFSEHSLIRDPPFSQLDLVSCRNVLIYLSSELQKRLVPLFHYALRPGGFLFLGPSEGIAGTPELFETLDKRSRIFRRRETVTRPVVEFPLVGRSPARAAIAAAASVPAPREPAPPTVQERIATAFERTLREEYTFPSAVMNERGDALFVAGPASRYLQMPAGPVAMPNLFEAFRGGLRHELRTALRAARTRQRKIVRDDIAVDIDDSMRTVRLIVRPLPAIDPEEGLFLVVIQEGAPATGPADAETEHGPAEQPAMEQLENELRSTRAELKTTVEELISTNEELQSANEELQTSKEELQSLNEELETVNAELREKVDELGTANSDLQNLFAATEIATIFLDRSLRVARFTPAATTLFHLIDADVGRPLADLAPRFAGQDLVFDAREVLRLLAPVERPVLSPDGTLFVLRVLPYRTVENVIAGVVITFVNVSEVKRAEQAARQQAQLVHLSHDAIMVWPLAGPIESWNRGAEDLYGYSAEEAVGRVSYELLGTVFSRPRSEIEAELRHGGCWVGEFQQRTKEGRAVTVLSNLQLARGEDGVDRVLEANRDITERKAAERRLAYLASFPENNLNPIVEADVAGRVRYANPVAARLFPDLAAQGVAHPWLANWQTTVDRLRTGAGGDASARNVVVDDRTYHQALYFLAEEGVVRTYGLDITERERAEEGRARLTVELGNRVGELQALLEAAPVAIWIAHDPECRRITGNAYANQMVTRTTGDANISRSALPGEAAVSFGVFRGGVEIAAEALPAQVAAATGKRVPGEEMEMVFEDGRRVHMLLGAEPLLDPNGRPRGSVTAGVDITALKLAEVQLRESEERFRTLASNAQDSITRFDREGRYVYANPVVSRLLRLPAESIVGRTVEDLGRNVGTETWEGRLREVFDTGTPQQFDRRTLEGRWFDVQLIPEFRGADVETVLAIARDVTERRRAEEALKESEAKHRNLFEQMEATLQAVQDGIAVSDMSGSFVLANDAQARINGYASTEEMLQDVAYFAETYELALPDGTPLPVEQWPISRVLRGESVVDLELRGRRKDTGREWFFSFTGEPVRDDQGKQSLAVVVTRDITERTRAEEALRDANTRLLEVDRRKNEFLAVLSHELRNPLTPIRYSLSILERSTPGSEPAKRAQEVIDRQTGQLVRLVDDLLDVTRVSRNKIQLQRRHLDLNHLVQRTVEDHRSLFEEKGITVEAILTSERLPIDGDEARLAQVVGNLLQNAAKFTPTGGQVSVATRMTASGTRAALRVADTGAGIELLMLRRLFQPFMQADMTLDRSTGGLGLGLSLVKGLVEMHGGEVCAHSDGPGKGAEFVVELPLDVGVVAEVGSAPAPPRTGRRVLIIEDNIDAADSLCEVLRFQDHVVEVAYSGREGLARAREFKPDVVLCDIGLPGMDGFEVARMFRRDESLKGIALIALSGYALPEDLQRAAEAGFRSHLAKPASPEKLEQVLADLGPPRS